MKLEELLEARRNPEQNPRISSFDAVRKHKNDPNIYISFTAVDKIGINPSSKYYGETPNGVYTYPLKIAWKEYDLERQKELSAFPFASRQPFIYILKSNVHVTDVTEFSSRDYDNAVKIIQPNFFNSHLAYQNYLPSTVRLDDLTKDVLGIFNEPSKYNTDNQNVSQFFKLSYKSMKEFKKVDLQSLRNLAKIISQEYPDYYIENNNLREIIDIAEEYNELLDSMKYQAWNNFENTVLTTSRGKSLAAKFWKLTRLGTSLDYKGKSDKNWSKRWSTLLRQLGFKAISDTTGLGIIHPSEPIQAVFFEKNSFTVVDKIINTEGSDNTEWRWNYKDDPKKGIKP